MDTVKEVSELAPARETSRAPEPVRVEPQVRTPSQDDDELEIPAFLRRT